MVVFVHHANSAILARKGVENVGPEGPFPIDEIV